ncbi:DoxX family protein [Pararhizobium polonicum]|uniref:DoxX family protein n=2 Tax=Pararhizobium polonicum TaxID=1612624 RepID=A0A1C7NX83_9HYPH|nr:DoxX family protein [Pararhizobium polonicum]OBZ93638.1 DoxX family protein [Pararhizobium polonicum]
MEAKLAGVCTPVFTSHPARWLGLLALCSAYIVSGATRLMDFSSAVAEMEHYGLLPPRPIAAVVILFQLSASAMVISGFLRWIGALSLAVFTVLATFIALRFWEMPLGTARFAAMNTFFEHLGLAGAFLLVAWYDLHKWRRGDRDWS